MFLIRDLPILALVACFDPQAKPVADTGRTLDLRRRGVGWTVPGAGTGGYAAMWPTDAGTLLVGQGVD